MIREGARVLVLCGVPSGLNFTNTKVSSLPTGFGTKRTGFKTKSEIPSA